MADAKEGTEDVATTKEKRESTKAENGSAGGGKPATKAAKGSTSRGKSGRAKASEAKAATKQSRSKRFTRTRPVEEHVKGYFDAIARRDVKGAADHWAQDGIEDIVPLAVLRGRAQIEEFFSELFAAFPDAETVVTRTVVDEGRAAVEWRMTATFSGSPFQGLDPNGRRVEIRGFDLFEVEDGRFTSNTAYYDGAAFARQVGMLPPPDSGAERVMKGAFNAVTRVRKAVAERTGW